MKELHGDLGATMTSLVRNAVYGRDTLSGITISEDGVVDIHGHRRVLLDQQVRADNTVTATTGTGTRYIISAYEDKPTTVIEHSDSRLSAMVAVRRADVTIRVKDGTVEHYADAFFGYDLASGSIVLYNSDEQFARRSSKVCTFEIA